MCKTDEDEHDIQLCNLGGPVLRGDKYRCTGGASGLSQEADDDETGTIDETEPNYHCFAVRVNQSNPKHSCYNLT